ncbi:N-acetyltransferase [Campylobacter sp. RM9344]|uniref:N-acetyltransferase n=1 Tax=Campylobacter californiensis TaxID=1032243 RepID=A0AAW3ZVQ0_9BACT|nr:MULTISPECIES: N-acetyltransferase [unclassified Campylobacter]MBE2984728.1 N-acetyltransferase [Campylobacter sp. RM6883]MBE2994644.1 N-acetyltransferase [Campylobacter sp. RM6913]MBE3029170.1 N-acetyltransferase [Campylobacter sp. RM9344]MBE3608161.1 N-acetyltransferase [Campylobacter sp. RM9337]QCD50452.1 acetyltransferase [Campylobacter sp. RM6914]
MITLVKPKPKDIKNMQELVAPEVASGVILPRSDDEISTNIRSYIIAKDGDKIVGFCALHIHAPDLAEIRSLIVDKNLRGSGIGSMMVNALLKEAKEYEISRVFTLTYQRRFFEKLGFKEIPKSELPAQKIWADCIKCKHFPVCDEIALIHNL